MNRTSCVDLRHLAPNRTQHAPLYLQLYLRCREAIANGRLQPGEKVPSVRSLASELGLSRGTVEAAYQMLTGEGYFEARGAAGTIVSAQRTTLAGSSRPGQSAPPPGASASSSRVPDNGTRPFQLGVPALDAFPRKTWTRLAGQTLRAVETVGMDHPDPAGYVPLRRAIAAYLGISRGIDCTPEQVFVTTGYLGALELVRRTLLQASDLGWYEDPGYIFARQYLERAGMRLAPIPVDQEGLDVRRGQQLAARARFAVVTPTHQSPTGVALSLPRRLELLDWAHRRRAWIIEDDYDSEFRYQGRPLPPLKSLDRNERVLYTGTFSKVLFPGLRLAYLVVPASLAGRFHDTADHLPGPGSILPQAMVADFMEQGHFARHLRKMRPLYAARRRYLADALTAILGKRLHVQPQAGGIHILAHLPPRQRDRPLAMAAQAHGLAVQALSEWRMRKSPQGGLLMGFASFSTEEDAQAAVRRLAAIIGKG